MPNVCCFCKKAQGSLDHAVSFHRFPKDPIQRNIWLQNCKLENTARIEHKTLCSDHFNSSCYISNTNRLLKNAVPTIFPGGEEHLMPEVVETLDQPAEIVTGQFSATQENMRNGMRRNSTVRIEI
ncbi:hypothetical protein ACI65C_006886 [Semiaphis heraclei]